jgi:beta-glucanase (GH16 family)
MRIFGANLMKGRKSTHGGEFPKHSRREPTLTIGLKAAGSALVLAFGILAASQSLTPPTPATGYRLVFNDEFDSLDLSPDASGDHTWYANVWFNHKPRPIQNISTSDGILHLKWTRGQKSDDTSIESASPDGRNFHAWKYGYFEARMKWDVVNGAWPAFWLIPIEGPRSEDRYDGAHEGGEFDVFEGQGDRPSTFFGTIHHWVGTKQTEVNENRVYRLPASNDFSQFHVYGMLWEPGKVTWFFDGRRLNSEKTYPIFDKQRYFLILAMQAGANWTAGNMTGVHSDSMTMDVDWVRVWQK